MANWKRPKAWVCIIIAISCILFTVACGTNPLTIEVDNDIPVEKTEDNAEITTQAAKLVDNVPRPERNVLFKTVETPYDFFSKVTLDDIDEYYMHASQWGEDLYVYDTENIDRLLGILDGIKEDDIKKMTVVPDFHEYDSDNDAYFWLWCDDVSVSVIYRGGEIYLAFYANANELGEELEKTNPVLYRTYNWQIESEALVELFEEYIEAFGGKGGPQLVDLTDETFTVAGEDLVKYKFRTDLQMIILEIEDPDGEFDGGFTVSAGGGSAEAVPRYIETDDEGMEIYEMYQVFPKYEYRMSGDDMEGCTVTLYSKDPF